MPIRMKFLISTISSVAARTGHPASGNQQIYSASPLHARQQLTLRFAEAL